MIKLLLILFAGLLGSTAIDLDQAPDTPAAVKNALSEGKKTRAAQDQKINLAVLGFTDLTTGQKTPISMAVTTLVLDSIDATNITLLERENVAKIIEAQEFAELDITEDGVGMFLGRLIDARYILMGTVGQLEGRQLVISARIVDVATGEIVDDHRATVIGFLSSLKADARKLAVEMGLRAADGMSPGPLQLHPRAIPGTVESVVRAVPRGGPVEMEIVPDPDKTIFLEGEAMAFKVRSDRDGYLTMLAIGPTGGITVLAPNSHMRSVPVVKDQAILLPSPDMPFTVRVEPPFGVHRIKAFVTPEPLIVPGSFDDRRSELLELARDASLGTSQNDPLDNTDWTCREIEFITEAAPKIEE